MSVTQYCVRWDSFKSNVCNGFTNLQQNEEFVDMTLAADGYLVRVHKSLFALASPYIKSMLQSTPNQYPIIVLDNVSHEILNYILTYVYTGEISVDADKIEQFMMVAKRLRICGLFGVPEPKVGTKEKPEETNIKNQNENYTATSNIGNPAMENITQAAILTQNAPEPILNNIVEQNPIVAAKQIDTNTIKVNTSQRILSSHIGLPTSSDTIANDGVQNNSGLYLTADGYQYKLEIQPGYNKLPNCGPDVVEDTWNNPELIQASNSSNIDINLNNDHLSTTENININSKGKNEINTGTSLSAGTLDPKALTPQYTMSNRGSVTLILNRYMYYCHHQSHAGRKRRWRCIDYRSKHCPAFIDTDCDIMTVRKFGHIHPFHDEKIRKKFKRDLIFTNLHHVEKVAGEARGTTDVIKQ